MKYSEVLQNPHFNNLAAIMRVPYLSMSWRKKHCEVDFWNKIKKLDKIKDTSNRVEFVAGFCDLLVALTVADKNLNYSEADIAWFIEIMDGPHSFAVASLLFAWASAPDTMLTPSEIAKATNTSDSQWRNKAAAGRIPGAIKKGKQWLLPRSVLRSQGVEV